MTFIPLPKPHLDARPFGARRLIMLTDEALFEAIGVRIAFTSREGGVSSPPFDSLNVGNHVGDEPQRVAENRRRVLEALVAENAPIGDVLVGKAMPQNEAEVHSDADAASNAPSSSEAVQVLVPSQVHGTNLISVAPAADLVALQEKAVQGCDGIVVSAPRVAPLLCFADCAPVILVAPTKTFAVVHAGWRGAVAGIASKALAAMALADQQPLDTYAAQCNVYIGPHIGVDCFETGVEVQQQFSNAFGAECVNDLGHVNLAQAIQTDVCNVGAVPERVLQAGICTQCHAQEYFSYRASGGVCGRHGACAFYLED